MRRFPIRSRLLAGFAILVILLCASAVSSFLSLSRLRGAQDEIARREVPELGNRSGHRHHGQGGRQR